MTKTQQNYWNIKIEITIQTVNKNYTVIVLILSNTKIILIAAYKWKYSNTILSVHMKSV